MGFVVSFGVVFFRTSDIHATIRNLESSLVQMGMLADRSIVAADVVRKGLDRIKAVVEQEMMVLMRR
jgi:hypothetical protein